MSTTPKNNEQVLSLSSGYISDNYESLAIVEFYKDVNAKNPSAYRYNMRGLPEWFKNLKMYATENIKDYKFWTYSFSFEYTTPKIKGKAIKVYIAVGEDEGCYILFDNTNFSIGHFVNIIKFLRGFEVHEEKKEHQYSIHVLTQSGNGFGLSKQNIVNSKLDFELEDNYNDSELKFYQTLAKAVDDKSNGLCVINSDPGCGKTYMLRKLIKDHPSKYLIVPPHMIGALDDPGFIHFAIANLKDYTVIVEDAEFILRPRSAQDPSGAVSTILNISDGILGDTLNILFVFTINADVNTIDKALLRKGRVIARTEFKPLAVAKANKLLKKLGSKQKVTEPTTLADLYNIDEEDFTNKTAKIGFAASK